VLYCAVVDAYVLFHNIQNRGLTIWSAAVFILITNQPLPKCSDSNACLGGPEGRRLCLRLRRPACECTQNHVDWKSLCPVYRPVEGENQPVWHFRFTFLDIKGAVARALQKFKIAEKSATHFGLTLYKILSMHPTETKLHVFHHIFEMSSSRTYVVYI
jgi:hypothetical protein